MIKFRQPCKDSCEPVPHGICHHTKIPSVNRCSLEAVSWSLSAAGNLHLNCIAHTIRGSAPEEVQTEPAWVQEQWHATTVFHKQIEDKHNAPQDTQFSICFLSYLSRSYSPWSHESWRRRLQYAFSLVACYLVSPSANTGVADCALYDRLGQRLRRKGYILPRGVSLTFIDQTDPLPLPLPEFEMGEWFGRKQNTGHSPACPRALGVKPWKALKRRKEPVLLKSHQRSV